MVSVYKKNAAEPYNTTLASDNPLHFRCNLLERTQKIIMVINKIRDEKLQYCINRPAAKISVL